MPPRLSPIADLARIYRERLPQKSPRTPGADPVTYYSGGSSSPLESKRFDILSDMDRGRIGTADTEERRRQQRKLEAPGTFPAQEIADADVPTIGPGLTWLGDVSVGGTNDSYNSPSGVTRSKPKFVVGEISSPRMNEYIARESLSAANENMYGSDAYAGQAYNWLAEPVSKLREGEILLVNDAIPYAQVNADMPTTTKHLGIVKDGGRVYQIAMDDNQRQYLKDALRSGLPVSVDDQLMFDYFSSPSQTPRQMQDAVTGLIPSDLYNLNQVTVFPGGFSSPEVSDAAGFTTNYTPSELWFDNKNAADPYVFSHEFGHIVNAGDDGTWDQGYRDALAADTAMQATSPRLMGAAPTGRFYGTFTPGSTSITEYGQTNPKEAWAELFALWANENSRDQYGSFLDGQGNLIKFEDMYPQTNDWIKNLAKLQLDYWPTSPIYRGGLSGIFGAPRR
jgi:hypothetical protein